MAAAVRYRRLAKPTRAPIAEASVARDGGNEVCDLFGFLALVEHRRHLPKAACATFGDRVFHERPAPGGRRDVIADAHVQIRADAPDRLHRGERMTDHAGTREQFTALL